MAHPVCQPNCFVTLMSLSAAIYEASYVHRKPSTIPSHYTQLTYSTYRIKCRYAYVATPQKFLLRSIAYFAVTYF